jgi:23S rRNA (uracil1939-C5)-methyltransferase
MGRYGNKNVYLEGGIPGETVSFTLDRRKQGFYRGRIEGLIYPSPHRNLPFCMHYESCGGCSWQHIQYPHQLELKHRILCHALEKYNIKTPPVPPVIPSPETRYFRHRMEYTFTSSAFFDLSASFVRKPALGFHVNGEPGKVLAIQECYLQAEPSREICKFTMDTALELGMEFYNHEKKTGFLRSLSVRINQVGEAMVLLGLADDRALETNELLDRLKLAFPNIISLNYTLHLSPAHSQLQGKIIPFGGTHPFLNESWCGLQFRIHATSFFQPNVKQAEQIFLTARKWARGHHRIYDLYTGVGAIALVLAHDAGQVIGIEGSADAIDDASENASQNGIKNVQFLAGDILETFKPSFLQAHGKPDLIVLDPPRSGTLIEIKKTINTSGAKNVLYLSCNPVSLAFDLKQLTEAYQVIQIQPFDMLPHTHHIETLVFLEKT